MAATVTLEADLSSGVRQYIELARRIKEAGGSVKDLVAAIGQMSREVVRGSKEEVAAYKERSAHLQALAKDVAQLTQIEKLQAAAQREASEQFKSQKQAAAAAYSQSMRQVYDEWKQSQKAFDEGAAAGNKLAKSGELVDFAMSGAAKSIHKKGEEASFATTALAGLSGRIVQTLGPAALLAAGIGAVVQAFRAAKSAAEEAAAGLQAAIPTMLKATAAAHGSLTAAAAISGTGIALARNVGIPIDAANELAASAAEKGVAAEPFARAMAAGQITSPTQAIDALGAINANLPAGKQLTSGYFVNTLLATAKQMDSTPDSMLNVMDKLGPMVALGEDPTELMAAIAAAGEKTKSPRQAVSGVQKLVERLRKPFERRDESGAVVSSTMLHTTGIGPMLNEAKKVGVFDILQAEAASDAELTLGLGSADAARGRVGSIRRAGETGASLAAAEAVIANDPALKGAQDRLKVVAEKAEASRGAALDETNFESWRIKRQALQERNQVPWIERLADAAIERAVHFFAGPQAAANWDYISAASAAGNKHSGLMTYLQQTSLVPIQRGADAISDSAATGLQRVMEAQFQLQVRTLETLLGIHSNTRPGIALREREADHPGVAPGAMLP